MAKSKVSSPLRVVELFAGVGGFRIGLEKNNYRVTWSNQWEPATKTQHAAIVYKERFHNGQDPNSHFNEDINNRNC